MNDYEKIVVWYETCPCCGSQIQRSGVLKIQFGPIESPSVWNEVLGWVPIVIKGAVNGT